MKDLLVLNTDAKIHMILVKIVISLLNIQTYNKACTVRSVSKDLILRNLRLSAQFLKSTVCIID